MKKLSYNEAIDISDNATFFHEDGDPYNQFTPIGMFSDPDEHQNYQKDGEDFEEFKQFKRKNRIDVLKKIKDKNEKDEEEPVLEPAPAFENMYNTWPGVEGLYNSPTEYYGGSIMDGPDTTTNSYNNMYQSACSKRMKVLKNA